MRGALPALLVVGIGLAPPGPAEARQAADRDAAAFCASFHLPEGRWAVEAAARMDRAGLLERDHPWGFRAPEAGEVVRALRRGAEALEAQPGWEGPARGAGFLSGRLAGELRGLAEPCGEAGARSFLRVEWAEAWGGAAGTWNELRMGDGSLDDSGAVQVPDRMGIGAGVAGAFALVRGLGVAVRANLVDGQARAEALHLTGRLGPVALWAGRRSPGYGAGVGGSVVLSGDVPLDGGGLRLERGVRLPWLLGLAGPVRFETALARMSDSGAIGRPWFWTARTTAAPAEWLRVGVNRGAFMGGEGNPSLTPGRLGWILLGSRPKSTDHESGDRSAVSNQVAALEIEVRGRLRGIPVAGYVEWGMEDSAGAWKRQPGVVAGLELPLLGASASYVGVELASFGSPKGQGVWYRHRRFSGGWADRGRLLGHPLGGPGRELRLHGGAGLREQTMRARIDLYRRNRHASNALGPQMAGVSHGARTVLEGRIESTGPGVFAELEVERARSGWERADGRIGLRWFF